MTFKKHISETLLLSYPVVVGQLGLVMMGVIDNAMVGGVSHVHLSASTLSNSIFFMISVLCFGVQMSVQSLISEADGAGESHKAAGFLKQGVWAGMIVSVLITGLLFLSSYLLKYANQPVEDVALAESYLRIIAVSIIPMVIFTTYKGFCDGLSDTRVGMVFTLVGLAANTLFNWMLIYGNWGCPALGLDGAGYGTLLARILMAVCMVAYVEWRPSFKKYTAEGSWQFELAEVKRILALGIPIGLQFLFEVAAFAGASIMIGMLPDGSIARAAHQIALSTSSVTFMACTGIATGASIRVGNFYGSKDFVSLRKAANAGFLLGVGLMAFFGLLFIVLKDVIPVWYQVQDPNVLMIASNLFLFAAAFQVFDGGQAVAVALLRGVQDVKIPTYLSLVGYWGFTIPLSILLSFYFDYGVYGFWIGFVIGLSLLSVALSWRFYSNLKTIDNS